MAEPATTPDGGTSMGFFRATAVKAALLALGLSQIAQAGEPSYLEQGIVCPLFYDYVNGGDWRGLTPTINDVTLYPGWTFCTTGLA